MTDLPVRDPALRLAWFEAEEAGDWQTLSELQVAEKEEGALPAGFMLVQRPDFIDRR